MQKFAIMEGNAVKAVQLFEAGRAPADAIEITDETGPAGVGFLWDGGQFKQPPKWAMIKECRAAIADGREPTWPDVPAKVAKLVEQF